MGQKIDGKTEIEKKNDGNSEMPPPLRPLDNSCILSYCNLIQIRKI